MDVEKELTQLEEAMIKGFREVDKKLPVCSIGTPQTSMVFCPKADIGRLGCLGGEDCRQ